MSALVILFFAIVMVMRVLQSVFSKKVAVCMPEGMSAYMRYIEISYYFSSAFCVLTLLLARDFSGFNAEAILIAAVSGCFLALSSLSGMKSLLGGTIVLSSVFSTAGLIIPCILGAIFFNEPLSVLQVIFIIVLLASTTLLMKSSKDIFGALTPKTMFWLIVGFVSNGAVMFCQKLFGMRQPEGNVSLFSLLTFLIPALFISLYSLMMRAKAHESKEEKEKSKLPKQLIGYAVILAFAVFVIQQLVTLLTPAVSSAVLFTIVNGGATVIAAIVGAAMYKEKLTVRSVLGIVLSVGAMVLIKVFE